METKTTTPSVQMEESWKQRLTEEFQKDYMVRLRQFLKNEYAHRKHIYPAKSQYFSAFSLTPFEQVKVVILGQDPYHAAGQAHGLCFSVPEGIALPPSLVNIYQELKTDMGIDNGNQGNLSPWARQGVLLLNSVLTVERGLAASHRDKGWEQFTDRVIELLSEREQPMVFLLWGSYAQKKAAFVETQKHFILKSPHPSPLSAHRGFFGCRHFSRTNDFLIENGMPPIDWELLPPTQ